MIASLICPLIVVAVLVFARWSSEKAQRFLRGEHLFPPIHRHGLTKITLHYGGDYKIELVAVVLRSIEREFAHESHHVYDRYTFQAIQPVVLPLP